MSLTASSRTLLVLLAVAVEQQKRRGGLPVGIGSFEFFFPSSVTDL